MENRYIVFLFIYFFLAKELIKGLLRTDPAKRLTIEEVMNNKWIAVSIIMILFLWLCIKFKLNANNVLP